MTTAKITILMPLYNRACYVAQAIESVLSQQVKAQCQLIILNDASTDGSLAIAQDYQKRYAGKIQILSNRQNLGLLTTIVKGYGQLAKSDYWSVLDADDYWIDQNFLQRAVDFFCADAQFTFYFGNYYLLDEASGEKKLAIKSNKTARDFSWQDYKRHDFYYPHTSSTVFARLPDWSQLVEQMHKQADKGVQAVRGDSWRTLTHLYRGCGHYDPHVVSVYRKHPKGIWTGVSVVDKGLLNSQFFLAMRDYVSADEYNFLYTQAKRNLFAGWHTQWRWSDMGKLPTVIKQLQQVAVCQAQSRKNRV